jgi:competence transcription factor ComK
MKVKRYIPIGSKETLVEMVNGQKMLLPLPFLTFREQLRRWQLSDTLVQNAFPTLSPVEREFLITGLSASQQKKIFRARDADPDPDHPSQIIENKE